MLPAYLENLQKAVLGGRYETAVPGTFLLVPPEARLRQMAADYREMQIMHFGEPTPWLEIVERLHALQAALNRPRD